MNKAQGQYWQEVQFLTADNGETARALRLVRAESALLDQDAQIERLARRLADVELELSQTTRILQSEQKAYLKLMNRICDAMGSWVGPWDDAAVKLIKAGRGR